MSDILEQINSLTEQFSNLFEVEGLGDPASDVPPSTNKIKKDRKTKDGKVELVSVEDELFPYDGNKREQYRQKIIDTINAMIQGTATLEDLLQIVRQKKMPVKEGFEGVIEILENLREQIDKKIKAGEINLDKALKLDKKIEDKMSSEKNAQEYYEELDKRDKKERLGDKAVAKSIRRNERKNANEGFEGAIEVLEDIHTAIEKGAHEIKRPILHAKAIMNYSNELQKAAKKELPKDKKKSIKAINNKMNEIAKKRGISPVDNYVGGNKTDESFEGAIEILEEIINEVSLKKWKEAAKNSYDKRKEVADKSAKKDKENWEVYDKLATEHPEDEPELYRLAQANSDVAYKDEQRAKHAQKVSAIAPDRKHSANKYLKTMKKIADYNSEKLDYRKPLLQDKHAQMVVMARHRGVDMDPVKSRTNESYILSELFDRPDLLDDISKTLTNKTIKQHLENQVKKLLGGKKKKKDIKESFDSFEENNYNIVKLLEELINEVSDGKHRRKLEELKDGIKKAEEFKEATKDDVVKEKIDDIIIPQEHRLEVSQNKYADRVVRRAQEEYDKNKAKKEKGK